LTIKTVVYVDSYEYLSICL